MDTLITFIPFFIAILSLVIGFFIIKKNSVASFFIANRSIKTFIGSCTIMAAWTWGPALLVSSQQGYIGGLAQWFWFATPNTIAILIFGILAAQLYKWQPKWQSKSLTLIDLIKKDYDKNVVFCYFFIMLMVEIISTGIQLTAISLILKSFIGISSNLFIIVVGLSMIIIASSKGMITTVTADMIKVCLIVVLVATSLFIFSSTPLFINNLPEKYLDWFQIFDKNLIWNFGIPNTIALIGGVAISGQMWQRAYSIKLKHLKSSIIGGSFLFYGMLLILGILGMIAAVPLLGIGVANNQLAGLATLAHFTPYGVLLFSIVMITALIATGASALNAGSMVFTDLTANTQNSILVSRLYMIAVIILGTVIAIFNFPLLYLIQAMGIRIAFLIPTILSLYFVRVRSDIIFLGIVLSSISFIVLFFNYGLKAEAGLVCLGFSVLFAIYAYLSRNYNIRTLTFRQ